MRTVFCGREAELASLAAAYERAAVVRSGPELIVVAAEAGLGKTRLVQELYNHLSVTHDGVGGAGYWPDDLGQIENNLKVNPTPSDCNDTHALPFLWWGVRLDDPGEKNAPVAGAVPSALAFLRPHLEPMHRARQGADREANTARILGRGAIDALIDLIPGGGLIKTGAQTAYDLYLNQRADRDGAGALSLGETARRERRSQNDMILDALAQLMAPDADPRPAVILFDDAQFSPADQGAVELFEGLVDRAAASRWPVVILVTHWIAAWHAQQAADAQPSIARAITQRAKRLAVGWLELSPVPDLAPMMAAALPGLSPMQRQALLHRAGGNPRYLEQIIALAKGRPRYFAGRDTQGLLTAEGFGELSRVTVDMQHTIEQRLLDAGSMVRQAVSLASVQGVRFSRTMTTEMAQALALETTDEGLATAEHPHAFINGVSGGIAEFAQRVFHEVALGALADVADPEAVQAAFADVLRARLPIGQNTDFPSYEEAEQTLIATAALFEHAPDAEDRQRCVIALFNLMSFENQAHRYANALVHAERLWAGVQDGRWPLERAGIGVCVQVGKLMQTIGRLPESAEILRQCVRAAHDTFAAAPSIESKSILAYALSALGEIYLLAGDVAGGSPAQATEALDLAARLVVSLDRELATPESRNNVAWAFTRLGDVLLMNGAASAALPHFERAHEIFSRLDAELGTSDARGDLTALLLRLGEAMLAVHGPDQARDAITQSYDMIAAAVAQHSTPRSRVQLATASMRMGDLLLAIEGPEPALAHYTKAFEIMDALALELGTPESLRNVSLALEKLGDATDDIPTRRDHYEACLAIKHTLIAQQRTRLARRDTSVILKKLGHVAVQSGAWDEAKTRYAECLAIVRELEAELATVESARDLVDVHLLLFQLFCAMEDEEGILTTLEDGISAAEVFRARYPGSDAEARLATFQAFQRALAGEHELAVADVLLTASRGDRTVALSTGRRTLAQLRAQLAAHYDPETEDRVSEYEAAVRELEKAVELPLH